MGHERRMSVGSLEIVEHENGLISLSLSALRGGVPTAVLSKFDFQRVADFLEVPDEKDDWQDLV